MPKATIKPQDFRKPEERTFKLNPGLSARLDKYAATFYKDPVTDRPSEVDYLVNQALELAFPPLRDEKPRARARRKAEAAHA
jgi:hypothetical protein